MRVKGLDECTQRLHGCWVVNLLMIITYKNPYIIQGMLLGSRFLILLEDVVVRPTIHKSIWGGTRIVMGWQIVTVTLVRQPFVACLWIASPQNPASFYFRNLSRFSR